MSEIFLRFISAQDIEKLDLTCAEIFQTVEEAVRFQGNRGVVLEPRVHLIPPNSAQGHFNLLRGHLSNPHVSGIKVVGDFPDNYRNKLPSELAMVTLYSPDSGVPLAIVDGTMITAARNVALTALGARYLARSDGKVLGHIGVRGTA